MVILVQMRLYDFCTHARRWFFSYVRGRKVTERTIVADEVTCPKCTGIDTFELDHTDGGRIGHCDCGCKFEWAVIEQFISTEVPSE